MELINQNNLVHNIKNLMDFKTENIKRMTQNIIEVEMSLVDFKLSLECLDKEHLKKAHEDTEKFKSEIWKKANKKKGDTLKEYKKLINYI